MSRCYIRNGVWAWSVERQEGTLGDLLDRDALYQDVLSEERAKRPSRVNPEWLTERGRMLRPSARKQDRIYVATLLAIAVSEADLVAVLAAASERDTTIVAVTGSVTPPGDVAAVAAAVAHWRKEKEAARTEPGRLEGVRVAAEKKRARTMKAVKIARPLWRDAKAGRPTTEQIADHVGLSAKTLYSELGRRPPVRKGRSQ